jgi:hypothetical protein
MDLQQQVPNVSWTSLEISPEALRVHSFFLQRQMKTDTETVLPNQEFNLFLGWLDEPARELATAELVAKSSHRIVRF